MEVLLFGFLVCGIGRKISLMIIGETKTVSSFDMPTKTKIRMNILDDLKQTELGAIHRLIYWMLPRFLVSLVFFRNLVQGHSISNWVALSTNLLVLIKTYGRS
jgi:hypothetical protein